MDDSPSYDNTDNDRESESELDPLYEALKKHDDIRFATYRTAAKLRYIQRRTFLHHIDIWNMIEAFRENGLNTLESGTLVNRARLETLLSSLYSSLNKRLPPGQSIDVEKTSSLLTTWLMFTYCQEESGRLRVFSIKMALAVLASGKLMDKLRYMFSQISDSNGQLVTASKQFSQFLFDIMKLPASVGERHTFNVKEDTSSMIFSQDSKTVTVNEFLETMMSDPGPQCVSWLLVLHRITAAEATFHPVPCSGCRSEGFHGLRYKSDSNNYHLCQMCFWRGNMDDGHRDDVFKEYSVWKVPGKPSSLRRSLRCTNPQNQQKQRLPKFPDKPEPPLDLSNMVPASPLPHHNGFKSEPGSRHMSPAISNYDRFMREQHGNNSSAGASADMRHGASADLRQGRQYATMPGPGQHMVRGQHSGQGRNEEHDLIATYARRLATGADPGHGLESSPDDDIPRHHRDHSSERREDKNLRLVHELEMKNAEIMREIARLRQNRATEIAQNPGGGASSELESLRARKMELEFRLNELQQTRKDLMTELEELMKVLQVQGTIKNPPPPSSSYNKHGKVMRGQVSAVSQQGMRQYPPGAMSLVGGHVAGHVAGYVRSPDNSETDSAPASNSMPASVNSLSE